MIGLARQLKKSKPCPGGSCDPIYAWEVGYENPDRYTFQVAIKDYLEAVVGVILKPKEHTGHRATKSPVPRKG
jgi:hypothetical protein